MKHKIITGSIDRGVGISKGIGSEWADAMQKHIDNKNKTNENNSKKLS